MAASSRNLAAFRGVLDAVVDTFEKLEILVWLVRGGGAASLVDVARGSGLGEASLTRALHELEAAGVVTRAAEICRIVPQSPWRDDITGLVESYLCDRIEVIKLISSLAIARVRSEAASVFADAFVLRRRATNVCAAAAGGESTGADEHVLAPRVLKLES